MIADPWVAVALVGFVIIVAALIALGFLSD